MKLSRNNIFVDTNVLNGFYLNRETDVRCLKYLFSLKGKKLFISSLSIGQTMKGLTTFFLLFYLQVFGQNVDGSELNELNKFTPFIQALNNFSNNIPQEKVSCFLF